MAAETSGEAVERFTAVAGVQSRVFARALEIGPDATGPAAVGEQLRAAGLIEHVTRVEVAVPLVLDDVSFDLVVGAGALHRADAAAALLAEVVRVLAPGGRLVLWSEPNRVIGPDRVVRLLRASGLVGIRCRTDGLGGPWSAARASPRRLARGRRWSRLLPHRWRAEVAATAFKPR